jgi:hypothetical protein
LPFSGKSNRKQRKQIFIESETGLFKIDVSLYEIIYEGKCSIGSAGVLHLSKAKWGQLDQLIFGKAIIIKGET